MDYAKLKTELELPAYTGLSDDQCADLLNAKTMLDVQSRFITARTILAEIADGAALLDKLEALATQVSAVKWAMKFLTSEGGLDIGHANTQGQIAALVAGGALTAAEGKALQDLALQPVPYSSTVGGTITYHDVAAARNL